MKKLTTYTLWLLTLCWGLTACTAEEKGELPGKQSLPDGTPVKLSFEAVLPEVATRTVGQVNNLYLLVFDQNHRYLYKAQAVVGEVVDAGRLSGVDYNPNNGTLPAENRLRRFEVTLLTSSQPRIVHFIANYDWSGFPKDYEIEGTDEGQIIPRLYTGRGVAPTYWQSFRFEDIANDSFHNQVFILLRNKAKFTVDVSRVPNFRLKGYCMHNSPDRGTVAPYYSKTATTGTGIYGDVLYDFPDMPVRPTIMARMELGREGDVNTNRSPLLVYEYRNTEADDSKQMFLILKGQYPGTNYDSYYKVDLVTAVRDAQGYYLGAELFDVVRNNHYLINIQKIDKEGYRTYEEAVANPAGNNLFASVELQDFPTVSDGTYKLSVDNTDAVMVLPGRFTSQIAFSSGNGYRDVRVYLNRKPCNGAITDDEYLSYANYNSATGVLSVDVKAVPTNTEKTYVFSVIATPAENPTVHIQRTISLTVRPQYEFNATLTEDNATANPQGERVSLSFTVPGTLPRNLFPYYVYIAADQLSPYVSATVNDGLVMEKRGTRVFYRYTVGEKPGDTDVRKTLNFQRTTSNGTSVVTMYSSFYNNGDVLLKNSESVSKSDANTVTGQLTFTGLSYTRPHMIHDGLRTKLTTSGVAGVTAKMVAAGYVKLEGLQGKAGNQSLTLTATMTTAGGSVVCTKTLTLDEWKTRLANAAGSVDMDVSSINLNGRISYREWRSGSGATGNIVDVPANATLVVVDASGSTSQYATIRMTGLGTYQMSVNNLTALKSPRPFRVDYNNNPYLPNKVVAHSQYLMKLLDNPDLLMSIYQ